MTDVLGGRTGSGLDPVCGLATDSIVDPGGLNLDTKTGYEAPGSGYLRPAVSALPSASLTTPAQTTRTVYYGNTVAVANPCVSGSAAVNQAGLPQTTTDPMPASGGAVVTERVYDATGRVVASRVQADGAQWTCTSYDGRGRVITTVTPAVNGATARTVTSNYGVGGDPLTTSVSDPAGTITTRNDLLGRTVAHTDTADPVTMQGVGIADDAQLDLVNGVTGLPNRSGRSTDRGSVDPFHAASDTQGTFLPGLYPRHRPRLGRAW